MSSYILKCESTRSRFQQGEDRSRGFLLDCEKGSCPSLLGTALAQAKNHILDLGVAIQPWQGFYLIMGANQ